MLTSNLYGVGILKILADIPGSGIEANAYKHFREIKFEEVKAVFEKIGIKGLEDTKNYLQMAEILKKKCVSGEKRLQAFADLDDISMTRKISGANGGITLPPNIAGWRQRLDSTQQATGQQL